MTATLTSSPVTGLEYVVDSGPFDPTDLAANDLGDAGASGSPRGASQDGLVAGGLRGAVVLHPKSRQVEPHDPWGTAGQLVVQ